MLAPKLIEGEGRFRYQKVFGDDTYMAAGTLEIPVGGFKPEKSAKDNTYVSDISYIPYKTLLPASPLSLRENLMSIGAS